MIRKTHGWFVCWHRLGYSLGNCPMLVVGKIIYDVLRRSSCWVQDGWSANMGNGDGRCSPCILVTLSHLVSSCYWGGMLTCKTSHRCGGKKEEQWIPVLGIQHGHMASEFQWTWRSTSTSEVVNIRTSRQLWPVATPMPVATRPLQPQPRVWPAVQTFSIFPHQCQTAHAPTILLPTLRPPRMHGIWGRPYLQDSCTFVIDIYLSIYL